MNFLQPVQQFYVFRVVRFLKSNIKSESGNIPLEDKGVQSKLITK